MHFVENLNFLFLFINHSIIMALHLSILYNELSAFLSFFLLFFDNFNENFFFLYNMKPLNYSVKFD